MTDINSILVVCDPTREPRLDDNAAAQRAVMLAGETGATIELFVCGYDQFLSGERFFDSPGLRKSRASFIDHLHNDIKKLATRMRKDGVEVKTDAIWDYPLDEGITRKVMRSEPDLVLKETHEHGAVDRFFFTNTDWHLIRNCPASLMLCKAVPRRKSQTVLAAVDPMHENDKTADLDRKILGIAGNIATLLKTQLHAVHAVNPIGLGPALAPGVAMAVYLPVEVTVEKIVQAHREQFEALMKDSGIPASHAHLETGKTGDVMNKLIAELDVGLVVMGAVARGRLDRILVGSTAEKVLSALTCDVLVVKPDGFQTTVKD